MKARTLLGTLLVIAAVVYIVYVWAWPQLRTPVEQHKGNVPPRVQINMPDPGDGG
jgi:hypothetical protein